MLAARRAAISTRTRSPCPAMKNVTLTLDDDVVKRARVEAAKQGKSLSRFVSDLVAQRVGRALTQKEAMDRFLARPLLDLTDENGKAPSRDELHE